MGIIISTERKAAPRALFTSPRTAEVDRPSRSEGGREGLTGEVSIVTPPRAAEGARSSPSRGGWKSGQHV